VYQCVQKSSDNLPFYLSDNHHCSDAVYCRGGGTVPRLRLMVMRLRLKFWPWGQTGLAETHLWYNNNNNNCFTALCPRLPGWAVTRRNTHPPTILIIQSLPASSIYHDPQHPPCSNYMLGKSFCTTSLHALFGLPLHLEPSTSYSTYFFTQPVSSFHNTCPYHHNLFCCSINII